MANIVIWSIFENGVGIIAASLPPIHKLFRFYDDSAVEESNQARAGAVQTIGGTPLSQPHGAFELKPLRTSSRLTVTKSGQWDRLDDEGPGQERVTVRRTFTIVDEIDADQMGKM